MPLPEAGDAGKALAHRLEAIRLLAATSVDAVATYKELLTPGSPPELQLAALRSAVKTPRGPALIVESWRSLSPAVKTEAIESLLSRPAGAAALLDGATGKRIPNHDLTPHRKRLAGHANPKIRELATRNLGESPSRTAVLKKYQPAATQAGVGRTRQGGVSKALCGLPSTQQRRSAGRSRPPRGARQQDEGFAARRSA